MSTPTYEHLYFFENNNQISSNSLNSQASQNLFVFLGKGESFSNCEPGGKKIRGNIGGMKKCSFQSQPRGEFLFITCNKRFIAHFTTWAAQCLISLGKLASASVFKILKVKTIQVLGFLVYLLLVWRVRCPSTFQLTTKCFERQRAQS